MPEMTVRERCLDALHQQLLASLMPQGVMVTRNRRRRPDRKSMPAIILIDGGHEPDFEGRATHFWPFRLTAYLEGHVAANRDEDLGAAASTLYGQTLAAALTDTTLGNLAVDIEEAGFAQELVREEGTEAGIVFALNLTITYATDDGDPYEPAP
jgi:hypothetical protein